MRAALALALVAAWVTVAEVPVAEAHQASITYGQATVDGAAVDYQIRIAAADLAEPAGLSPTTAIELATLGPEAWARIASYVSARVTISNDDAPCAVTGLAAARDGDRARVSWRAVCAAPVARLAIDYQLFFDLDPAHDAALRVSAPGHEPADTILVADAARFVWDLAQAPPSTARAFIRAGVHHVATGFDHIAFVIAMLIALVVTRTGATWQRRSTGAAVRAAAARVSAFTLAHSLTLIAAALGWVELPTRLVEAAIALSIVWTALAAWWRPDARGGFAITFGFGLMHGLGFARMLAPMLPPGDVIVPLVCFNVGVELAQLAIVAVVLPTTSALAHAIGAARYRRYAVPPLAIALATLGAIWLIERTFAVRILGW